MHRSFAAGRGHRAVAEPAGGGGGDAQTRRHADLHDPGGRAAELRRASRGHLCDDPRGGAVLQRADPGQPAKPGLDDRFRLRCLHRDPEPADGGRTYAFPIRDDVRFQDGSALTAYDVAASWNKIVDPPEGVISPRRGYYSMIDKVEAPDPKTVVFRLKFATAAFLPALADPYAFIYKKEILDRDPHWFEKNIMGSGPFRFKEYQARAVDFRRAQSRLLPPGPALSRRVHRHFRRQAGGPGRRDPRRPGGDRVPRLSAGDARRAGRRARRPDHGSGERLELRQPDHPEPQEEAVRRRPGAPR